MTRQQRHHLTLGEAVREIREERHFLASDLARASGVSLERIAALEDGRLDPHDALLLKLAESMGIRTSAFYKRAEELGAKADEAT